MADNKIFAKYTDAETFNKIVDYSSLTDMWESSVKSCGDSLAVIDEDKEYTYAELDAEIAAFRAVLTDRGIKAGDVVVINPYEFHTTLDGGGETPGKYHLFMIGLDFFSGDGTDVPDLRHLLLGGQIAFKTHFPYAVKIGTLLQILLFEYGLRSPYYRLTVRGLLMQIFAHLLREGVR